MSFMNRCSLLGGNDAFTNNTQFIGQRYADEDNPFR